MREGVWEGWRRRCRKEGGREDGREGGREGEREARGSHLRIACRNICEWESSDQSSC